LDSESRIALLAKANRNFSVSQLVNELEDLLCATLSTRNPTRLDLGSKPGHHVVKQFTNRLSYGAALKYL
jgi:hypothetical protein